MLLSTRTGNYFVSGIVKRSQKERFITSHPDQMTVHVMWSHQFKLGISKEANMENYIGIITISLEDSTCSLVPLEVAFTMLINAVEFWYVCNIYSYTMTQGLFRNLRRIVKTLTPERFDTAVQEMLDLDINSEEELRSTVEIIYEKV